MLEILPRLKYPGFLLLCLLAQTGCQWQQPKHTSTWQTDNTQTTINLPAARLVDVAGKAIVAPPLSLLVESVADGKISTGWKEYQGELHIIRHWFERTRYRITVTPDFTDPTGKSHIAIEDQTEERAAENQPWYPAPQTRRPERGQEVLRQIIQNAQTASDK